MTANSPRPDAVARLSGTTRFTADLIRPGMLHAYVLRSCVAAAELTEVDVSRALEAPGVHCVLTGADVPATELGLFVADEPLLARDVIRYPGEPIALIAADTYQDAKAAAQLIDVRLDVLEPVLSISAAITEEARSVRAGKPNVTVESRISRGNVESAFAQAVQVVRTEVTSQRVHQAYIEPRASLAEFVDGTLIVNTSSQAPFEVRSHLAALLELPMTKVIVRVPAIGGGFGGKLHLGLAGYAAVLSKAAGRPVMVVATREDEFRSPAPRENSLICLESAVAADGTITARRAVIHMDCGAYAYDTPPIAAVAAMQGCGPYRVDAIDITAFAVYTNSVPTGSFRAPSGPQMSYAVEAHMNDIAAAVDIESGELRRLNALRGGDVGPTGQLIVDDAFPAVLDRGLTTLDEWRCEEVPVQPGEVRGLGIGCAWWTVSPVGGAVALSMNEDATFVLSTGGVEIGTGAISVTLREIAGDTLGVSADAIHVLSGATDSGPYDHGSQGSRTLYGVGTATCRAADEIRTLLVGEFARMHEVAPSDVVLADGAASVAGDPSVRTTVAELGTRISGTSGPIVAHGRFQPEGPAYQEGCVSGWVGAFNEPTFHCHVADVVVDTRSGRVRINRIKAIHDVGGIINRDGVNGQVEGGVIQGIGYALSEEIVVDESGRTLNSNLHDYRIPTMADTPGEVIVDLVSDFATSQAYRGLKGIGEAPIIPVAAALGSAIRDALGAQPMQLPMNPERLARLADEVLGEVVSS